MSRSGAHRSSLPAPLPASLRLPTDLRGFTIVETMVAIVIIGVAFTAFAGVHALSSRAQSLGQNQGLARFVADQQLETMRRTPVDDIAASSFQTTHEGVTFNVNQAVANVDMGRRVTVAVSWTDRFGPRQLTFTTIVSQVTNPPEP